MDDSRGDPMGLLTRLFGSAKYRNDESLEEQKKDLLKYSPLSGGVINKECDQIPGAYGSFGIAPTNPIPVNGVIGEMVYLFRLRSRTGVGFYYHRLGHISSPPSSNPIDHYELVAADASEWCDLYFDCYYPRRSTKTPNGFTLLSWNSLDDQLKMMSKLPVGGVNIKINNFPHGLPDAIEVNKVLNDIYPDLGSAVAKKIRMRLSEYKGKWGRKRVPPNDQFLNKVTVQMHLAEYLAFLMHFFTDFEDIKTTYKFKNKPNNLDGLIDFAFFLDMITNLPTIFTESSIIDMKDVIHRFVKDSVNAIPGLNKDFGATRIHQAKERVMLYSQLLNDDLKNRDTCNYQSIREFLKDVFSGQITEEEKVVLTNILHKSLPPVRSLIMMQSSYSGADTNKNADYYYNRGIEYLSSDKNKAINEFSQAIAADIKHKNSYLQRGIAFYKLEKYSEALSDLLKVLELDPTMNEPLPFIGNMFIKCGEYEMAKKYFSLSLANNPHSPLYHYKYGIACSMLKEYDAALKSFSMAINLGDEIPSVYYERGVALFRLNDYASSLKDLQHYLKCRPDDYRGYEFICLIYGKFKEYNKSLEYINKAISLNPQFLRGYYVSYIINMNLERYDDAIIDCSRALEIYPDDTISYVRRGRLQEKKGKYFEAKQDWLQVINYNPEYEGAKEKIEYLTEEINKLNLSNTSKKIGIGARELGEKYFKLFVLGRTKDLFEKSELILKLQITKNTDSNRELNILSIFSVINHMGRTRLISNDIKDSIINNLVNSYLNFIIEDENKNEIDTTEALISQRIKQYSAILKKYEKSIFEKDKTEDKHTEFEIMNDIVTILGNLSSHAYSEKDISPRMYLFALFMELVMYKPIEDIINSDLDKYDIKNSELDDEMPDSVGDDFIISKRGNGMISIKRK